MSAGDVTAERIASLRRTLEDWKADRIANASIHAFSDLLDALEASRAEVDALREEVCLTNEHEHQILQERNEAREEVAALRRQLEERGVKVPERQGFFANDPESSCFTFHDTEESARRYAENAVQTAIDEGGATRHDMEICYGKVHGRARLRDDPDEVGRVIFEIEHYAHLVSSGAPSPDVVPVKRDLPEGDRPTPEFMGVVSRKPWEMLYDLERRNRIQ